MYVLNPGFEISKVIQHGDGSFGVILTHKETGKTAIHVGSKKYLRQLLKKRYGLTFVMAYTH